MYQAVLDSPDDMAVRLVYADALEEFHPGELNERHAELIRTQVALYQGRATLKLEERAQLLRRIHTLLLCLPSPNIKVEATRAYVYPLMVGVHFALGFRSVVDVPAKYADSSALWMVMRSEVFNRLPVQGLVSQCSPVSIYMSYGRSMLEQGPYGFVPEYVRQPWNTRFQEVDFRFSPSLLFSYKAMKRLALVMLGRRAVGLPPLSGTAGPASYGCEHLTRLLKAIRKLEEKLNVPPALKALAVPGDVAPNVKRWFLTNNLTLLPYDWSPLTVPV